MNYARVITDLNILSRTGWFFKENFLPQEKEEKCAWMAYNNRRVSSLQRKGDGSMAARKKKRAPRRPRQPSKFKKVLKIIGCTLLIVVFLGAAGAVGYLAANHYHETKVALQAKKDAQEAERKAQRQAQEAREKARHPKKSPLGDADSLDEAGTLTQEMEKKDLGDGRILYSYTPPTEDGIYIVPYIIRSTADGSVLFYISVRHIGMTPQGFPGVDVMTDEETKYSFRPEAQQVTTTPREGGITESFDEQVNARTLKALRDVGQMGSAKIIFPREGGSNDDRLLTAVECQQVDHMLKLYQYLQEKKQKGEWEAPAVDTATKEETGLPFEGEFTSL